MNKEQVIKIAKKINKISINHNLDCEYLEKEKGWNVFCIQTTGLINGKKHKNCDETIIFLDNEYLNKF